MFYVISIAMLLVAICFALFLTLRMDKKIEQKKLARDSNQLNSDQQLR